MPEQLLARIILASSRPQDLVLDPFGGSGTTLCVAKKLGRRWLGFELSKDYVTYISRRMDQTSLGDPIDGPEDPIESSPSTLMGKQKKKPWDEKTQRVVIDSYEKIGMPVDYLLCDKDLNAEFTDRCIAQGLGGNAHVWNRFLLYLRKTGKLPKATRLPKRFESDLLQNHGDASEVAWRLLAIDYQKTLDELLCSPEFAEEFDRLAATFAPEASQESSLNHRRAAMAIRKYATAARRSASDDFTPWLSERRKLPQSAVTDRCDALSQPGVFSLHSGDTCVFVGDATNMDTQIQRLLSHPEWAKLDIQTVKYVPHHVAMPSDATPHAFGLKAAIAIREKSLLNCRLLVQPHELHGRSGEPQSSKATSA